MNYTVNYLDFTSQEYLNENLYLNSVSLYMRNSATVDERIMMYYDIYMKVLDTAVELVNRMDIAYYSAETSQTGYFQMLQRNGYIDGVNEYETKREDYFLDAVGSAYGLDRNGLYANSSEPSTNFGFLYYILFQAAKRNYDGTMQSFIEFFYNKPDIDPDGYEYTDEETGEKCDYWDYHETYTSPLEMFNIIIRQDPEIPLRIELWFNTSMFDSESEIAEDIYNMIVNGRYSLNIAGLTIEYYINGTQIAANLVEDEDTPYPFYLSLSNRMYTSILVDDDYEPETEDTEE